MVDVRRAYRRWTLRRLIVLVPALGAALACGAIGTDLPSWARVISASVSGAASALLAYLLALTAVCAWTRSARVRRGELASYRGLALLCLAAVAPLLAVPALFREAPVRPPQPPIARLRPPPARAPFELPSAGIPIAPRPAEVVDVPSRLEAVEDVDLPAPPFPLEPLAPTTAFEPGQESEFPGLDATAPAPPAEPPAVERLGLPRETGREGTPLPLIQLSVFLPDLDGYGRGGALELRSEVALDASSALRAGYFVALFARGESFPEGEPELAWQRMTLEYQVRLMGRTRHAPFDLLVNAGFSVDAFQAHDAPEPIAEEARLSPHVGVDVGRWEGGSWGVLLRARHSFPFNATGASIGVTDVAFHVRADLTEGVSLQAGWRHILVALEAHEDLFGAGRSVPELEAAMSGPQVSLEFRF
ncbi:MAG TPA: hypothetical protein VF950_01350 [Planctomycetota bacterium]